VEKFNLLDVVTCDRIVARLTSKYPYRHKSGSPQNAILPVGSRFENLRIGDEFFPRIEVPAFFRDPEHASWDGLQEVLENKDAKHEQDCKLLEGLILPGPDRKQVPLEKPFKMPSVLGFCIALDRNHAPLLHKEVAQFGTVHLGEFFCYPQSRRLVMLRVELGCPQGGGTNGPTAMVNGGSYPPGT